MELPNFKKSAYFLWISNTACQFLPENYINLHSCQEIVISSMTRVYLTPEIYSAISSLVSSDLVLFLDLLKLVVSS